MKSLLQLAVKVLVSLLGILACLVVGIALGAGVGFMLGDRMSVLVGMIVGGVASIIAAPLIVAEVWQRWDPTPAAMPDAVIAAEVEALGSKVHRFHWQAV